MIAAGKLLLISGLAGLVASASLSVSRLGKSPVPARHPAVQAVITNGLSQKLLVSCGGDRKAIVTHAVLSDVWCDPNSDCHDSLDAAVAVACK
ncbi:MAG: hypothetical protein RIE56_04895 [Amphiplicatus sp.]